MIAGLSLDTLATHLLAVAGSAALGALGVGATVRLAGRAVGGRKAPQPAVVVVRLLGAVAGGLAAWLWLFGPGGPGWGPGGGGSVFGGAGAAGGTARDAAASTAEQPLPVTGITQTSPASDTVRVTMLGGERVKEERFYEVDGEKKALTFPELIEAIHRKHPGGDLKTVEIFIYRDSVAEIHLAVRRLIDWAKQNGLAVRMPPAKAGNAP